MKVIPESLKHEPAISYKIRANETIQLPGGWKIVNVEIEVEGLDPDSPVIELKLAKFGVYRMATLIPQPLGEIFNVAWDGNVRNPSLRFDMWPDKARVLVSMWGR